MERLSKDPDKDFTIGFVVQREQRAFLIGKGGSRKKQLEDEFGMKIIVNNNSETFTLHGQFENKKKGIIGIKYVYCLYHMFICLY